MTGRVLPFDPAAHKVADVLLPWYANGTLEGDELAFVSQHVASCSRCQREVEWLREFRAACVAAESADPDATEALRSLVTKLDERPAPGRTIAERVRFGANWPRWLIVAQLALIAVLGGALFVESDPALYRTLATGNTLPKTGAFVVVFDPATTESDLSRILRSAGARVVDGPTDSNAYVLDVPGGDRDRALRTLRSERSVVLVERLSVGGTP